MSRSEERSDGADRPRRRSVPDIPCSTLLAKRLFDVVIAGSALVVLGLPMLIIAGLIRLDSPGPALFRQERVGRGGHLFRIHKFRTMRQASKAEEAGFVPGSRHRITRLGAVLRRSKIDELPQLLDVLLNNMSLVGPRPEVPAWFFRHRAEDQAVMAALKPGITDFATLRFVNEETLLAAAADPDACYQHRILPRKARYARFYAAHMSLSTDCAILLATAARLFRRR